MHVYVYENYIKVSITERIYILSVIDTLILLQHTLHFRCFKKAKPKNKFSNLHSTAFKWTPSKCEARIQGQNRTASL